MHGAISGCTVLWEVHPTSAQNKSLISDTMICYEGLGRILKYTGELFTDIIKKYRKKIDFSFHGKVTWLAVHSCLYQAYHYQYISYIS